MTDIASAMSEITYLLEEMQNTMQYQQSAFKPASHGDDEYALDTGPAESATGENMPATLDELKDILSKKICFFFFSFFLIIKSYFYFLFN